MRRPVLSMCAALGSSTLSPAERFLFDLNGFAVVRGVFSEKEVDAMNAAIDLHADGLRARGDALLRNTRADTPMSAAGPRRDMGGMLWWPKPQSEHFREVLTHPKLLPYYHTLCGEGYRMDHQPLLIVQERDSEGFSLHGGPISGDDGIPEGRFNPELQYRCINGQPWTSLLAVSVQLCDHAGDGGFCIVRGSHKLNLPVPEAMTHGTDGIAEHLHHPVTKKGDVVIWAEATVHGATPWRASHQRRIALYRFAPANMGYGRGYLDIPRAALDDLSAQQRAVLEPPYAARLERPLLTAETVADAAAPPLKKARHAAKKQFDKELFGTDYF